MSKSNGFPFNMNFVDFFTVKDKRSILGICRHKHYRITRKVKALQCSFLTDSDSGNFSILYLRLLPDKYHITIKNS